MALTFEFHNAARGYKVSTLDSAISLPVIFQKSFLSGCGALVLLFSGCATAPQTTTTVPVAPSPSVATADRPPPTARAVAVRPSAPAGVANIRGSEESSMLLDDFTTFVAAIDGVPVPAGRKGWSTPVEINAGGHVLTVEFIRGVFSARSTLELNAVADARYELRFKTDAQLFGHNSFCDFWVVDLATGEIASPVAKASVTRIQ